MMWYRIKPLEGENSQKVKKVLSTKTDIYGTYEDLSLIYTQFYEVVTKNDELIAFFGLSFWKNEVVLSCVYVYKEWRRKGVFKSILKYAKKAVSKDRWLTINATNTNVLANRIYARLLEYSHFDAKENVHWYIVRKIKKRGGN